MAVNAPLTIRFATDTAAAKAGMQDLAASVTTNAIKITSGLKTAVDTFDAMTSSAANINKVAGSVSNLATAAAVGGAAFLALSFVINTVQKAAEAAQERVDGLVKIATQAQAGGVGTTFLQGWLGQAKALNTEVSTLQAMLTNARAASTDRLGTVDDKGNVSGRNSSMRDALQAHIGAGNISREQAAGFNGAETQEARIRAILDLVEELRQKGMDLAAFDIGSKMFGPEFETQLRNGSDIIARMRESLDGMTASGGSRVVSPEEIANAQAVNAELEKARQIMADALAPLSRDIAAWQGQQAIAMAEFNTQIAQAVAYAMKLYSAFSAVGDAITNIGNWSGWATLGKALGSDLNNLPSGITAVDVPSPTAQTDPLKITVGPRDRSRALPSTRHAKAGGGGAEATDPVQSYIDQLSKSTAALQAEADAFGKSNVEKQVAIDLARANAIATANGTTLTEAQTSRIRELASATGALKDKMADQAQSVRENTEAMRAFGSAGVSALSDMLFNSRSLDDALKNMAKTLANQALQGLLMGSGPLAGFMGMSAPASQGPNAIGGLMGMLGFGNPLGAGRASGGPVQAGRTYTVGEMGREVITMGGNGYVTPLGGGGGGGGGGLGVTVVDQRTMAAPAPEVSRGPGGNPQIVLRDAEAGLAKRAYRGQGPLAGSLSNPGMRRG